MDLTRKLVSSRYALSVVRPTGFGTVFRINKQIKTLKYLQEKFALAAIYSYLVNPASGVEIIAVSSESKPWKKKGKQIVYTFYLSQGKQLTVMEGDSKLVALIMACYASVRHLVPYIQGSFRELGFECHAAPDTDGQEIEHTQEYIHQLRIAGRRYLDTERLVKYVHPKRRYFDILPNGQLRDVRQGKKMTHTKCAVTGKGNIGKAPWEKCTAKFNQYLSGIFRKHFDGCRCSSCREMESIVRKMAPSARHDPRIFPAANRVEGSMTKGDLRKFTAAMRTGDPLRTLFLTAGLGRMTYPDYERVMEFCEGVMDGCCIEGLRAICSTGKPLAQQCGELMHALAKVSGMPQEPSLFAMRFMAKTRLASQAARDVNGNKE